MKLLKSFQADRLISQIGTLDRSSPDAKKVVEKLSQLGPAAIPRLLEALELADRDQTPTYVELLGRLLDAKTLHYFTDALTSTSSRVVQGVTWALASRKTYDPNQLMDLLERPGIAKARVLEVLDAHKDRLDARLLLRHAYELETKEKESLLQILSDVADESLVPELLSRLTGKDPVVRAQLIAILARFPRRDVITALHTQLDDRDKTVRGAALTALADIGQGLDIARLVGRLRDPQIDVQTRAVEVISKLNHPDTARHLVSVLKDEDEQARRAAVEVLNEIGTVEHIKDLLNALKDDDWWVRSRATDALASIGGPRVVDAVLALFKDRDEEIRRAAIEIINTLRDERAVNYLIEATRDPDWWVRERAADALAGLGNRSAVPALVAMLAQHPESVPAAVRALAALGDAKAVNAVLPLLERPDKTIKVEAINALVRLADDQSAGTVRTRIQAQSATQDPDVDDAVLRAVADLNERFSPTAIARNQRAAQFAEPARTLLIETVSTDAAATPPPPPPPADTAGASVPAAPALDLASLQTGEVLDNRYRYIEQIGRGAFGTVILVEDTIVGECLVLKFLNKNIATDEEMMQRFVHELKNSRKITHRNVIRLYDFLYLRGFYAISMEYFPSHPLGAELAKREPLQLSRALRIVDDIATGMTVAHHAGIVHRDLKPANILINDEDLVKIVDFGVSAALNADTHLTKTGYVIGSPKYMAPEQILGKEIDQRADVYSLGVILYELLSGRPPYGDGDQMSVMYQHVQGKARPVKEMNPSVPDPVNELVRKMMVVDKLKRLQSMEEVQTHLRAQLH
jgi:eukaryotic-like serine/threonine-protein kinase